MIRSISLASSGFVSGPEGVETRGDLVSASASRIPFAISTSLPLPTKWMYKGDSRETLESAQADPRATSRTRRHFLLGAREPEEHPRRTRSVILAGGPTNQSAS